MHPILAGRSEDKIRSIAENFKLEYRIFSLKKASDVDKNLHDIDLVVHCAGPFSVTSKPMVEGCIRNKCHYLDITGEIDVFEANHFRADEAEKAEIVIMSGIGFDVVPSDCLAATLANELPDAVELELVFNGLEKVSPGTTKTAIESLQKGGRIRQKGKIVIVPQAYMAKKIQFADKTRYCMSIPWGDVSTAYYSTKIDNIIVYAV